MYLSTFSLSMFNVAKLLLNNIIKKSVTECQKYFGVYANQAIEKDDDVICTTEFSKVSFYTLVIYADKLFTPMII